MTDRKLRQLTFIALVAAFSLLGLAHKAISDAQRMAEACK